MNKLQHIRERIVFYIDFFTQGAMKIRYGIGFRRCLSFFVCSGGVTAVRTNLLALDWLPIIALVSSAVATVVAVWEAVFAYRKCGTSLMRRWLSCTS